MPQIDLEHGRVDFDLEGFPLNCGMCVVGYPIFNCKEETAECRQKLYEEFYDFLKTSPFIEARGWNEGIIREAFTERVVIMTDSTANEGRSDSIWEFAKAVGLKHQLGNNMLNVNSGCNIRMWVIKRSLSVALKGREFD